MGAGMTLQEAVESWVEQIPEGHGVVTPRDCQALADCVGEHGDPTVFEFGSGYGQTTSVIIHTLQDSGRIWMSEMASGRREYLIRLSQRRKPTGNADLLLSDIIEKDTAIIPDKIDALVIDAEHNMETAHWYIDNLWSRCRIGATCWIHDMYDYQRGGREYDTVMEHLDICGWEVVEHTEGKSASIGDWDEWEGATHSCALVLRKVRDDSRLS